MSEESYRRGYQDGWFYDEQEAKDPDYLQGIEDDKEGRKKSDLIRRTQLFDNEKAGVNK
jgi:hypothetical protein